MRLIDADELTEAVWRERLDTRERIADLVARQPTVKTDVQVDFDKMRLIDADELKDTLRAINLIFLDTERNTLADVQPVKHGRWEVHTQKDGTTIGQHSVTYCSECGYVIFTKENSFCARCGARMDGDRE